MACYHQWFRSGDVAHLRPLSCGKCIGCKLERARQWAVRCMHEAQLHEDNVFVTLTYEKASFGQSLDYRDFQLFMKRLRKAYADKRIRFFMCGEYGERRFRPHFHALLFGLRFEDQQYFKKSDGGDHLYTSEILSRLWGHGHCLIGSVTFDSACYVARYCTTVQTLPGVSRSYEAIDLDTGEVYTRVAEFGRMSLRPGIGAAWYERFKSDVYPEGKVVVNGRKARAPTFYDRRFRAQGIGEYYKMLLRRSQEVADIAESMPRRLEAREAVVRAGLSKRDV